MKNSRVYTKELLQDAVENCINFTQVCRYLNKHPRGATYQLIKNRIKDYELDTSHFLGCASFSGERHKGRCKPKDYNLVLIAGYKYRLSSAKIRGALLRSGVKYECSEKKCGLTEWHGKKLRLHVDHIDGDWSNCEKINLRFLCPNCHSQTETHSGKNNITSVLRFCTCGKIKARGAIVCRNCDGKNKRKASRPPMEELLSSIKELGYEGVGRKYGVTGNAIKKWIKTYNGE